MSHTTPMEDPGPTGPADATEQASDHPHEMARVAGLTKDYGTFRALDDITFTVRSGITGLLGPNGAGKSTLIKVLMGLVRTNAGQGHVLGYDLGRDWREVRARIGYMPEDDCFIPGLSGVEMVRFGARLSGIPSLEALRRAHEILDFCGLEQERYREVDTYSSGMRQKLKFAQAIVHDPPLLILDEPTATLDPNERESMLSRIRVLCRQHHKSVLISTHILPDVQSLCDHVIILAHGRIKLADTLENVSRPAAPMYQLTLAAPNQHLSKALSERDIRVKIRHDRVWELWGVDETRVHDVWEAAQETRAAVRSLSPAKNSLEQVFLEAVAERADADS